MEKKRVQHLNDGDSWILAEDIPDIDFQFSQIWISFFVNDAASVIGTNYTKVLSVYDGYSLKFYLGARDSERVSEVILHKIVHEDLAKDINKNIRFTSDALYKISEQITSEFLQALSNEDLVAFYQELDEAHTRFYEWSWLPNAVDMFHGHFTNHLKVVLEKYLPTAEQVNKALVEMSFYPEKSFVQEETESLLQIAVYRKEHPEDGATFEKLLTEHHAGYFFLKHLWVGTATTTLEEYRQAVDDILAWGNPGELLAQEEKNYAANMQARDEAEKAIPLTVQERELFAQYAEFAFTKTYRRYAQLYWAYKMDFVFRELAKRLDISFMETRFMLPEEVRRGLLDGLSMEFRTVLAERTKHCVYYVEQGLDIVAVGDEAQHFETTLPSDEVEQVTEFSGQVACVGKVVGRVRIVNVPADIDKVEQGDILVSIATNPDILPAMKKAVAFVTEQGGITSHAAIVAREMKKPCIIGTKIATKVLKDGDLVEVDAESGIVKILGSGEGV